MGDVGDARRAEDEAVDAIGFSGCALVFRANGTVDYFRTFISFSVLSVGRIEVAVPDAVTDNMGR